MWNTLRTLVLDALLGPPRADIEVRAVSVDDIRACYRFIRVEPNAPIYACSEYHHPLVSSLIRRLKFGGRRESAPLLAELLMMGIECEEELVMHAETLVMPIPLSYERYRARGYNQSELIAREVACRTPSVRFTHDTLTRTHHTPAQTTLSRNQRLSNVQGVFSVSGVAPLTGARILLIDDVATTGATLREARSTLLRAGARDVIGLACAH